MRFSIVKEQQISQLDEELFSLFNFHDYAFMPTNLENLKNMIETKQFVGFYIDVPYQKDISPYLDVLNTKIVDTIIQRNNQYYGYNALYESLEQILNQHKVILKDKKILIIGNTPQTYTVKKLMQDLHAGEINIVDESLSDDTISYIECYAKHLDSEVVINASYIGMNPNIDQEAIDLNLFSKCDLFIDLVADPIITKMGLVAKERNINYISGLEIRVSQIKRMVELFKNIEISNQVCDDIFKKILIKRSNVVLIGMPSCGKSTIGKTLEKKLNKKFIDMDEVIVQNTNVSIPEIFNRSGEAGFRKLETITSKELSKENGLIIGTGGGTIKNKINIDYLKLNGIIIFIDRDLENLITYDPNRPLSSSQEAVKKLYMERYPLYKKYASFIVNNNGCIDECVDNIIKAFHNIKK